MDRRTFLRSAILGVGAAGVALPRAAVAQDATPGAGPYGSIEGLAADENGIIVPEGFSARLVAVSGELVPGTDYPWHRAPDGAACFATPDGGWNYVCNSEVFLPRGNGGVGAIEFDAAGTIIDARAILTGSSGNCAGGPTPWGTWLSCEEFDTTEDAVPEPQPAGMVWETDPTGQTEARALPAMGLFQHEAAAVDPVAQVVYLTEDKVTGHLYRFTPTAYPDLAEGGLDAAVVGPDNNVTWIPVPDPSAAGGPVRNQVPEATQFNGGEGIWHHDGVVYFSTKHDGRIHALYLAEQRYELIYDQGAFDAPILDKVDNVTVDAGSGDVYVAEDSSDPLEIVIITPERELAVFVRLLTELHPGSEITGPCFSPDHSRLYFSSQRGGATGSGLTFEVTGPFRGRTLLQPAPTPVPSPTPPPTALPEPTPTLAPTTPPEPSASAVASPTETIAAAAEELAGLRDGGGTGKVDGTGIGPLAATGLGVGVFAAGGMAAWAWRRRTEEDEES